MAPPPRMLTPSTALASTGVKIADDELAYVEGKAIIVFPNPASAPAPTGKGKGKGKGKAREAEDGPKVASAGTQLFNEGQGPEAQAFLNPMQEFNRDLSIAAISTWERDMNTEKVARRRRGWERKVARDAKKLAGARNCEASGSGAVKKGTKRARVEEGAEQEAEPSSEVTGEENGAVGTAEGPKPPYFPYQRFTVLEALAATGLRSVRYAKELEHVRYIFANDLSSSAVAAMRRNVLLNFPADKPNREFQSVKTRQKLEADKQRKKQPAEEQPADLPAAEDVEMEQAPDAGEEEEEDAAMNGVVAEAAGSSENKSDKSKYIHPKCRIKIHEGDALDVMYNHRTPTQGQFDVIDLDPYGSASIFLDGAVQSVSEGGLLCVTCTDLAVLAGGQYPEKSYSLYGGTALRTEYSHEIALRLVLNAIASNAGKYGRYIQPMLSLSIDFYLRVFVRVWTSQVEVKKLASQTALVWGCQGCGNNVILPMGRIRPGPKAKDGKSQSRYSTASGPPIGNKCDQCGGSYLMGGPIWSGPLHDTGFCERLLEVVNEEPSRFGTASRIRGMVSTAAQELGNAKGPKPGSNAAVDAAEAAERSGEQTSSGRKLPQKEQGNEEEENESSDKGLMPESLDSMFYFTPTKISGVFHSNCAPLPVFVNGLLNAGYKVSRSHCIPGSLKTDCPKPLVLDLHRTWLKEQQKEQDAADAKAVVKGSGTERHAEGKVDATGENSAKEMEADDPRRLKLSKRVREMSAQSPAHQLNSRLIETLFDIKTVHPEAEKVIGAVALDGASHDGVQKDDANDDGRKKKKQKIVRYQENPAPNWGPGTAAKTKVKAPPKKGAVAVGEKEQQSTVNVGQHEEEGGADEREQTA